MITTTKRALPSPYLLFQSKKRKENEPPSKPTPLLSMPLNWNKGMHELKYKTTLSSAIKQLFSWNGFLLGVSVDDLKIYMDVNLKCLVTISFCALDIPIIAPTRSNIYMIGMNGNNKKKLLSTITCSSKPEPQNSSYLSSTTSNSAVGFVRTEIKDVSLLGMTGVGCVWNNYLVGRSGLELFVIQLDNKDYPIETVPIAGTTFLILAAQSSLWVVFSDHTKLFGDVDSLLKGKGISLNFSTVAMCYWNEYDCVATASYKSIRIRNNQNGKLIKTMDGHLSSVTCLRDFKNLLYSGSYDGEVRVWNWEGICVDSIFCSKLPINTMCMYKGLIWVAFDFCLVSISNKPWKLQRLLWLGHYKNTPQECLLALLPRELVKFVVGLL